jgi:hypothetical protein
MAQCQRSRGKDRGRWTGITLAGQNVEDDVGGMDAMSDRLGTNRLDGRQTVSQNRVEDVDICRLPSSAPASLRRTRSIAAGSTQSLKGAPLRKAPVLRASTGT